MRGKIGRLLRKYGSEFHLVVKGAVYNFLTNLFGSVVSLVSSLLIAKYFGSSILGTIAVIAAVLSIANLFSNFGFSKAIVRLIPEYRTRFGPGGALAVYRKTLDVRLLFMGASTLVYFLLLDWIEAAYFDDSALPVHDFLLFSTLLVFFGAFYGFHLQTLRALKHVSAYNLLEIAPRIMLLLLLGIVIVWFRDPVLAVYAKMLGDLLSALFSIVLVVWVWKHLGPTDPVKLPLSSRQLVVVALPFFISNALYVLSTQIDVLMIGSMLDAASVGIYQVAAKLTLLLMFVVQGIGVLAGPTISEMYYGNQIHKLEAFMRRISTLLMAVLVPMFILFFLFGESLLGFFGEEFRTGYLVMVTMALTVLVQGWYGLGVTMMGMVGHQGMMSRYLFLSVVINIGLNVLLIPRYGIDGAAFATLVGTIVANALGARYIVKHYGFAVYPFGARQ